MIPGGFFQTYIYSAGPESRDGQQTGRYTRRDYFLLIETTSTKVESSHHPEKVRSGLGFIDSNPILS